MTTKSIRILTDTHVHRGKPVPKGTVLHEVDVATADHLVSIKAAEAVTAKEK